MKDKLKEMMITAMKEKQTVRKNNIKYLLGEIQNKEKSTKVKFSSSEDIIKSVYKQSKDSLDFYEGEEADKINDLLNLCDELLPKQATEKEVREYLNTVNFRNLKNKFVVIGLANKHFNGNVDNNLVKSLLKDY
jgi:uncharacterized protein YqeY